MNFKLNKIEKFLIRYYKTLFFSYFIVLVLASLFFGFMGLSTIGSIFNTILLTIMLYVISVPTIKAKQLQKLNDISLDMSTMIDGCNQMIEAYNPKDTVHLPTFCLFRITALINIGDFDRAEQELKSFWQYFNLKKHNPSELALTHILMANIMLEKGDMKSFNDQMNLVYQYRKNAQGFAMLKNTLDYNITSTHLFAEAVTADETRNENDYEARVLEHLNTNPINNKPNKKQPQPMFFMSAYSKLFVFFKRTGNTQKTTYYAQQIVNIGNEQLVDYRKAKEYIENENSSN